MNVEIALDCRKEKSRAPGMFLIMPAMKMIHKVFVDGSHKRFQGEGTQAFLPLSLCNSIDIS